MYFLVSVDVSVCFYVFGCMYVYGWFLMCVCSTEYVSVCGLCLLRVCVYVSVSLSVCGPEDLCRSNIGISFRVLIH